MVHKGEMTKSSQAKKGQSWSKSEQNDAAASSDDIADGDDTNASSIGEESSSILSRLALFGDSSIALGCSFGLLLISIGVSFWVDAQSPKTLYELLGPIPTIGPPIIYNISIAETTTSTTSQQPQQQQSWLTKEMKRAYLQDGVIAVRGAIPEDLLVRLDEASRKFMEEQRAKDQQKPRGPITGRKKSGRQFYTVKQGVIFQDQPIFDETNTTILSKSPFLELALFGSVPQLASELLMSEVMGNDNDVTLSSTTSTSNLTSVRMLRDIFLAKDKEEYICGWHVDDLGFWPANAESPGVNAWIAFDDMPVELGGGFALAVGSHKAAWRDEAYYVTGTPHTFPEEGFRSAQDVFERRTGNGTCNIKTSANHLHRRMEETRRIYNVRRGDVIFHTRWLFHRTVPFEREIADSEEGKNKIYRRYSIRYNQGSAIIPKGYGAEPSVLWDDKNGGKSADEVSETDGPWYPRVWPNPDHGEMVKLRELISEKMPRVEKMVEVRKKEMIPHRGTMKKFQPH